MWEFSAVISREHIDLSVMFWSRIESFVKTYKGVTIENTNENITITISIPKKQMPEAMDGLHDIISEILVLYFKANYLEKNLQLPLVSEKSKKALLKALAVFDKKTDIDFVKKQLSITKQLHLESFYEFKLVELRLRWQEICELMQDNVNYLLLTDSFNDLTRYLIRNTEPEIESIYLYISQDKLIIRDFDGNNLCEPILMSCDDFEIKVVYEMIYLAPRKIFFKFDAQKNKKLSDEINELFLEKVLN